MSGQLTLKWGTIKGWNNFDEEAYAALREFKELGMSSSAMMQERSPEHIEAMCKLIDVVDEPIWNDWSGEKMTREDAKKYVREYGK